MAARAVALPRGLIGPGDGIGLRRPRGRAGLPAGCRASLAPPSFGRRETRRPNEGMIPPPPLRTGEANSYRTPSTPKTNRP